MTERSPATFIVGAGPVATALAGALRGSGVPVLGLWARRPEAARAAGTIAGVAAFSSAPPDMLLEAEAVIVAVRDAAVPEVAQMLLGTGLVNRRHVLIHCTGAISAEEAFASVRERVRGVAVMHPLRAIADGRKGIAELRSAVFGVEGDEVGSRAVRALVQALGGTVLPLASEQMATYHAAAALASNLMVAVLDGAVSTLMQAGFSEEAAVGALVPLAKGALDHVAARGLVAGLTGPVQRGDADTVRRHLQSLAGNPTVAALYQQLSQRALQIAGRGGLAAGSSAAVASVLASKN